MTIQPAPSRTPATQVPAVPVLVAGVGAQVVAVLLPFTWVLAPLLTAGVARYVSRNSSGAAIARTGLAVGVTSAVVGLLIGGLGVVSILLAGLTIVAGVAGAVAGRGITAPKG
ncbi:hypothetical protein ACQEVB_02815 [Pseudonocardia sp. CA-107938]|uniref:hypothetical protein n=1 Tax=Pseudonocardia sp. CA-107938 TaxID=3240021 RepID=UPI003D8F9FA2